MRPHHSEEKERRRARWKGRNSRILFGRAASIPVGNTKSPHSQLHSHYERGTGTCLHLACCQAGVCASFSSDLTTQGHFCPNNQKFRVSDSPEDFCVEKDRVPVPTQLVEPQTELLVPCLLGEAVLLEISWLVKHRQDTHVLLVLEDKQRKSSLGLY